MIDYQFARTKGKEKHVLNFQVTEVSVKNKRVDSRVEEQNRGNGRV